MKARPPPLFVFTSAVLVLALGIGGTAHARRRGKAAAPPASHGEHRTERRSARQLADGRRHLNKANEYAGANKWWSAVKEYTIAFEKLADPVVLFNRADCYRRIGENDRAIADYRAFLRGFPKAPNRADIEAKIAALETLAGRTAAAAPAKDASKAEPPARPEAAKPDPAKTEAAKTEPATAEPARPAKTEEQTETAAREPASPVAVPPAPPLPVEVPLAPDPAPGADPVLLTSGADPVVVTRQNKSKGHGYWWIWVLAGTVVAAGGATAYVVLRPHAATIPTTDLGNYRF